MMQFPMDSGPLMGHDISHHPTARELAVNRVWHCDALQDACPSFMYHMCLSLRCPHILFQIILFWTRRIRWGILELNRVFHE
jgi:hypothetical protein